VEQVMGQVADPVGDHGSHGDSRSAGQQRCASEYRCPGHRCPGQRARRYASGVRGSFLRHRASCSRTWTWRVRMLVCRQASLAAGRLSWPPAASMGWKVWCLSAVARRRCRQRPSAYLRHIRQVSGLRDRCRQVMLRFCTGRENAVKSVLEAVAEVCGVQFGP
jgi:hypothetical protein